jgi:SagB-type dehydrogenase family enzyme
VILFTSTFWRNAWKYRARAYRHAFWDSGTLLANLLAVARARKTPARLVLGFSDDSVNELLDVDPDREAALGLVALGRVDTPPPPPPGLPEPLNLETTPLSPSEVDYPAIRLMHQASSLEAAEEVRRWRSARPQGAAPEPKGDLFPLEPSEEIPPDSLEDVIRRRGSTRRFARESITLAQLSTILERSTRGVPTDCFHPAGSGVNELYLIVHEVDGLPPGAYAYHPGLEALEQLEAGDFRQRAGYLDLGQPLAADAAVNIYTLTRLESVLEQYGNRGYRVAQLEGGILGGKIYLAAYAQKLGATGLTFFDDDVTEFFSPHARGKGVMFLMAVGRSASRKV